jgi:ABC-type transport system involved in multi-copper enzyme maturation permease subunit
LTLLPIAERELRVSARNKATHRWRIFFAVGAGIIAGAIGLLSSFGGGFGSQLGLWTFNALKWCAFVLAGASGVFLTSDCLSEEKREGTLGLLFLTDLRGHDVVLGKLFATSLRTFYSLLAIFPIMALSFVMGGVAAGDFWHTLVAICNMLFFSLALGMVVSVVSREAQKAMTATLGVLCIFLFLGPTMEHSATLPKMDLLSPLFSFTHTTSFRSSEFWWSILIVQVEGWCLLAIASGLAPRTWHEKGASPSRFSLFVSKRGKAGRATFLESNPVCWIIARDRWSSIFARLLLVFILTAFALSLTSLFKMPRLPLARSPSVTIKGASTTHSSTYYVYSVHAAGTIGKSTWYSVATWCSGLFSLVLEFWLAAQVCRFYVDGKRTGFLELLLVTPTRPADIIRGHWLALRRLFLGPVAGQLLLMLACGIIQSWAMASLATPPAGGAGSPTVSPAPDEFKALATVLLGAISWFLGLLTIVWYSIWMGVTSKRITVAMLKTFCYAKVLPYFGISFAWFILVYSDALPVVVHSRQSHPHRNRPYARPRCPYQMV